MIWVCIFEVMSENEETEEYPNDDEIGDDANQKRLDDIFGNLLPVMAYFLKTCWGCCELLVFKHCKLGESHGTCWRRANGQKVFKCHGEDIPGDRPTHN